MSGDDEIIIRNGSLGEWARYALLRYFATIGRVRVRMAWVALAALAAAFALGHLVPR